MTTVHAIARLLTRRYVYWDRGVCVCVSQRMLCTRLDDATVDAVRGGGGER